MNMCIEGRSCNVFDRHFARYRHFDRLDLSLPSTMTATARAKHQISTM